MKTDKISNLEGLSYEAPSVTSLDIMNEGLLCQSGSGSIDNATEEDWGLLI